MNRNADFCQKTNPFQSIRLTNRIDSNRELEYSTGQCSVLTAQVPENPPIFKPVNRGCVRAKPGFKFPVSILHIKSAQKQKAVKMLQKNLKQLGLRYNTMNNPSPECN